MVRIRIRGDDIAVSWEEWEERVRAGRVPADAYVSIPLITGDAFVRADSLDSWAALRQDEQIAWQRTIAAGGPPVITALLIGFQFRIWLVQWIPGWSNPIMGNFANFTPSILEEGQSWRLVTMGFVHQEFDHIALNMLWLAYTGWNVERALGRRNLVAIFLAAVVVGACLSAGFSPWRPSIGASGGIFGLVAACVVFGMSRPELLPESSRRVYGWALLPYLVLMFGMGLRSSSTDNWAHFGGIVTGALLAVALDPEPLQRRPDWNRAWRLGIAASILVILAIPPLFGPRIDPLVDQQDAAWQALRLKSPDAPPPEEPEKTSITWSVPVGWVRGTTTSGDLGFCSPLAARCFGVAENREESPTSVAAQQGLWEARVKDAFGDDATFSEPRDAVVGGWPGREIDADMPKAHVEWRVAVRGNWALTEVWQVDRPLRDRLDPLRDRLRAAVTWTEPLPVAEARATLALAPTSRTVRGRWAAARAEIGDVDGALADWRALVAENPLDEDAWIGFIGFSWHHPDAVPDRRDVWDAALKNVPTPQLVVAVAAALDAEDGDAGGDGHTAAIGLLDLAWRANPGDRQIRRARQSRGQPVVLDPVTHAPWESTHDVITGAPRAPDAAPDVLSWEAGADRGAELDREELAIAGAVGSLPVEGAVATLLRAKSGPPPADLDAARAGLIEDLRSVAQGGRPLWMSWPVQRAVAARLASDPAFAALIPAPPPG